MPKIETGRIGLGAPLEWTTSILDVEEREVAMRKLRALGLSRNLLAHVCGVQQSSVKRWQEQGMPADRSMYYMATFDRLAGLVRHMSHDLALEDDAIAFFLRRETAASDDYFTRHEEFDPYGVKLAIAHLWAHRGRQTNSHRIIEGRLMQRFPRHYEAYWEAFKDQETPTER